MKRPKESCKCSECKCSGESLLLFDPSDRASTPDLYRHYYELATAKALIKEAKDATIND